MKKSLRKRFSFIFLLFIISVAAVAQPTFTSSPVAGATGVNENGNIVLTFNEAIRGIPGDETLDDTNIDSRVTLKITNAAGADIPFDATINGGHTVVTINPTGSLPSSAVIYVAIGQVEAISDDDDIDPNPTSFTFTVTDYQNPIISFNPANGATQVAVASNIIVNLDETIRNTNGSAIDDSNVGSLVVLKLTNAAGANVPFTATINDPTNTIVTIDPTSNLNTDQLYYVSFGSVEDLSNNGPSSANATFTTIDTQPPVPTFSPVGGATGVSETGNITISFNEAIRRASDDATLDNTNVDGRITLKITNAAGADIPFDATIAGNVITIDPTATLPSSTVIYVAIAGVEDVNNNTISPDPATITFTTGDTQGPVPTFSPLNLATGVSTSGNITITFNEAIRRSSDNAALDNTNIDGRVTLKLTNAAGADIPFDATIAGNVVTIDPASNLPSLTVIYVAIAGVEDASNNSIGPDPATITFTTGDSQPPVPTFNPLDAATGVNETGDITITFDEAIRRASDDAALNNTNIDAQITLKITNAAGADIPFDATIAGNVVTINPSSTLPSSTVIYVAIAGVEDAFNNAISPDPTTITFTTGDTQVPIISFNPAGGATQVPVASNIVITLSELIRNTNNSAIDDTNVGSLITLKLTNAAGANVPFTATINDPTNTIITIDPTSDLNTDQVYYVNFAAVEDASDNATIATNITFTTIDTQPPSPTFIPVNLATGVGEGANIVITFNEAIRRASDNAALDNTNIDAQITLKVTNAAGANIPFDATISGNVVNVNPTGPLPSSTVIYVAIAGVEDLNNNAINPDPTSITFTTGDTQGPVPTFNPVGGATGVNETSNITITFNETARRASDDAALDDTNIDALVTLKLTNAAGANIPFDATIVGNVVTIDPTSILPSSTVIYVAIGGVEDALSNMINPNPTSITFTTGDTQPPVPTFNPVNGATGIIESSDITITFNETIRRASDNAALNNTNIDALVTLKVTNALGANIPFDATIAANVITINPSSNLPSNTVIYVAIGGVEDAGNNAVNPDPTSITFTTDDSISPTVSFAPSGGSINASASGNIIITFNEPVREIVSNAPLTPGDLATLVELKLTNDAGAPVGFSASIDITNQIITVNPTLTLSANTVYYVEMHAVEDAFDNPAAPANITFTTEQAPGTPTFTPAATCIGDNVTVNGARFEGTGNPLSGNAEPTVTVGGFVIPSLVSHNAGQVVFTLPPGVDTGFITVRNNDSDLVSANSASMVTVYEAIDQTLSVTTTPPSPAQTQAVTFAVPSAQSGFTYTLFLDAAPVGITLGNKDNQTTTVDDLDGGTLSETGLYDFRIAVSRTGCTTKDLNAPLDLNVAALLADAGSDATICTGESVILGGNPPGIGGNGFNNYSWSPSTGLNCSNCPNPTASPTSNTTYTLTLTNSIGGMVTDDVDVTVNPTTIANFVVQAYPGQNQISPNETNFTTYTPPDKPIILNGIVAVGDSTDGIFTGPGVGYKLIGSPINDNRYVFNPSTLNVGTYDITYTYIEPITGCESSRTKTFTVFSKAINGLADEYCSDDVTVYPISIEPTLIPSYATATGDFFIAYPAPIRNATTVVNNGGSVTFTVPNHGMISGNTYFIQAYYGFSGPDAPFGYISGNFAISNVTLNTFDIPANVTGTWDRTGSYIVVENPMYATSYNLIPGNKIRVTTDRPHGFYNGVRPRHYIEGLSFDGGLTYGYYFDATGNFQETRYYFPITVINASTYDINLPSYLYSYGPYVNPYQNEYKVTSFSPNMGPSSLNTTLAGKTTYDVGYFITENSCPNSHCTYPYNTLPVRINQIPNVDFATLALNYCFDDNSPITLTGTPANLDGTFTINTGVGLLDGGLGSISATLVPSTVGAPNVDTPLTITYAATDAKGCANSIDKITTVRSLPVVDAGADVFVCNDGGTTSKVTIGGSPTAVGTPVLSYSWTSPSTLNSSILANPLASPTVSTLYTVTVTDGFGCTDDDDAQVTVNAPATVNAGPPDVDICSASPLDLSTLVGGTYGGTATEAFWGLKNAPLTGNFEDGSGAQYDFDLAETFTPTGADVINRFVFIFLTTDDPDGPGASGPCPAAKDSVEIVINATPGPPDINNTGTRDDVLSLTGRNILNVEYHCVTPGSAGAIPSLSASGTTGATIKWYDSSPDVNNYTGGIAVNPFPTGLTSSSDALAIFYATQVDLNGCEGTFKADTLIINPAPLPDFTAVNFCEGDFVQFAAADPISTVIYTNGKSGQITNFHWRFDENNEELNGSVGASIPANQNHGGRTTGTFDNPSHRYTSVGTYAVTLTALTSDACTNTIVASNTTFGDGTTPPNQNLRIGKVPVADFTFANVCEQDATTFAGTSSTPPIENPISWDWDFADAGAVSIAQNPSHTFTNFNTYQVQLTVTTNLNCTNTITRPVFILPYIEDFTNPYTQSFEASNHGWVHEGLALNPVSGLVNDSWNLVDFSVPANQGSVINSAALGNKAFITRAAGDTTYRNSERSVLYGPCIDLTALPRPALSFAYWNNTQVESDGVYVELSVDGGSTWSVLGSNQTGLRWYNESSIGGLTSQANVVHGGNVGQPQDQFGFSGHSGGWKVGKFSLDSPGLTSQQKLRVRFVFGSNGDNPPNQKLNGFAMDYFKLESRERIVLAENFTNLNETANNNAFNTFKQAVTNDEVVKIQYHTSLKGQDDIHDQNQADPNARVAFYGITTAPNLIPRAYLDGYSEGNFMQAWPNNYYSLRSLEDTPFQIGISTVATDDGAIEVKIDSIKATLEMPITARPILRVAIVEKTVGTNEYVLRKFLPSAAGYPLYDILDPNGSPILPGLLPAINNFKWVIDNPDVDQTNLAVVAFIQDKDSNLEGIRQVYQTVVEVNPIVTPDVVTGTEDPTYANRISLFPNPANHEVNIQLPNVVTKTTPVLMFDTHGRTVYENTFAPGERNKTVPTSELTGGVYIIQIVTPEGNIARKKVMVVHR